MEENFSLSLPAQPKNVRVARLTLAAIASRLPFDVEQIEDMKLAVAEACNNVIEHAKETQQIEMEFKIKADKLDIIVKDQGKGFGPQATKDSPGLGLVFMQSLMDEVEFKPLIPSGTQVRMAKKFPA